MTYSVIHPRMNFKLAAGALLLGLISVAAQGCAADSTDAADDGDAEEAAASQDELNAAASKLVGAYHGDGGSARPPRFDGLVLSADGSFFADVDTGIRCFRAPCPSEVRLKGHYTATKSYLRLTADPGSAPSDYYGRYKYTHVKDELTLTRTGSLWNGWSAKLAKELSYCSEPTDCNSQGLIHPMCWGGWTCGNAQASNVCSYKCGIVPVNTSLYPADATQVVAWDHGGGFTPPPPAGSQCAVGAQKYTLDVATQKVDYETCKLTNWQTPLTKVTGSKTLSATELKKVTDALSGLKKSTSNICGADKPLLDVAITSASNGTTTYKDDFYSCNGNGPYVSNIGDVFGAFQDVIGQ